MLRRIVLFFTLIRAFSLSAEMADTLIAIDAVEVRGIRYEQQSAGTKLIKTDSLQLAHYEHSLLTDLMLQTSIVQVNSYGAGGVSSIKIRGGNSDQIGFIWNGLNIKPPMSGDQNLSNIHTAMFDNLAIQPGPSSARHGTGSATGLVYLSNTLRLDSAGLKANASAEYGSFETLSLFTDVILKSPKAGSQLKIAYLSCANNFEFVNQDRFGNPTEKQEHAGYQTISLLQHNTFKPAPSLLIETDVWYTHHFKQIPSLTSDLVPGTNEQTDENLHIALSAGKYANRWFVKYRSGFLYYSIDYLMALNGNYSNSLSKSFSSIHELESHYKLTRQQSVYLGINYTLDRADVSSYSSNPRRNNFDLFGSYRASLIQSKLLVSVEARQAWVDSDAIPLVYGAGAEFKPLHSILLKTSFSKLYNLPDLNDLYWAPTNYAAGNPDLLPENGWSAEGGIIFEKRQVSFSHLHEFTVYRSELNNAILWAEDSNRVWIPGNYEHSLTSGLEYNGQLSYQWKKNRFVWGVDYVYTDAHVLAMQAQSSDYFSKLYIPQQKAGLKLQLYLSSFSTALYSQMVGERPVNYAGVILDPYYLADWHSDYRLQFKSYELIVSVKIKNVFNTSYQLRPGYAQALRSYYTGIHLTF
ncbi:MAG: TonB-dependent receptor [Bacteroidota bacterium]|nr:MAG: TonB-dependent receptor [Bacteroidota bacterium]